MLAAARKEPAPVNIRRLTLGTRALRFGIPPVVHGPAEVHEGAHGDAG